MTTATPRQIIDRLNQEQRAIWDAPRTIGDQEPRAARLHAISVELQDAWDAERISRAAIKNPQSYGVLPILPRRHR